MPDNHSGLTEGENAAHLQGQAKPMSTLLTVDETASDWRVNRSTVWRKIRSGELPVVRIGGRTLVRRVDADAFIERCLEGAV
jgi:excisionase family DNA binding protein